MRVAAFLVLLCASLVLIVACSSKAGEQRDAASDRGTEATCGTNDDCEDGRYCAKSPGECEAATGECRDRPELCTQDYTPVCGCDGVTYSNSCTAAASGVNVDRKGTCDPAR